jgi:preprotein translocase subunit SecY
VNPYKIVLQAIVACVVASPVVLMVTFLAQMHGWESAVYLVLVVASVVAGICFLIWLGDMADEWDRKQVHKTWSGK